MSFSRVFRLNQALALPGLSRPLDVGTELKVEDVSDQYGGRLAEFDPPEVVHWLKQRGWSYMSRSAGGTRDLYGHDDLKQWNMRWEQAVAYETFRFLNMGTR